MSKECKLREANDIAEEHCDESACIFWRAVSHLGEEQKPGCAIEHYDLLGDSEVAKWLLSVKERLERQGLSL